MGAKSSELLRIVMFGAGNVAFQLTKSLTELGHIVVQIVSRTEDNAKSLAEIAHCDFTTDVRNVRHDADLYIMCVSDSVISELSKSLTKLQGIVVHTSGSTSIDVLSGVSDSYGVFYPFQTFTKGRDAKLAQVPFCLETSDTKTYQILQKLVVSLGGIPVEMNSKQRQILHLTGVFSCNFANHMFAISQLLTEEYGLDFNLLSPLIRETVEKALKGNPIDSQTGPAIRGDSETLKKHMALLSQIDEDLRDLYLSISNSILNFKQYND